LLLETKLNKLSFQEGWARKKNTKKGRKIEERQGTAVPYKVEGGKSGYDEVGVDGNCEGGKVAGGEKERGNG